MIKCLKKQDLSTIPSLYESDDLGIDKRDKTIHLHFYNSKSHWFIIESNGVDTYYGVMVPDVDQNECQWRDIPFEELQPDQNFAQIKCDLNWLPVKAESIQLIRDTNNWGS